MTQCFVPLLSNWKGTYSSFQMVARVLFGCLILADVSGIARDKVREMACQINAILRRRNWKIHFNYYLSTNNSCQEATLGVANCSNINPTV